MEPFPRTALRLVLKHLPLEKRAQLRRVCSYWNDEIQRLPAKLMVEKVVANKLCIQVNLIPVDAPFDEPTTSKYIMPSAMSFCAFSRNIANIHRSISLDLRFCKERRHVYRSLNERSRQRKWTSKQLTILDYELSRELFRFVDSVAPHLEELKINISIPLRWKRRGGKFIAIRPRIFPVLSKMNNLQVLSLPAEFLMSKYNGKVELPQIKELTLTLSRAKVAEIPPILKRMHLSLLRDLNMCIRETVQNVQEKRRVLQDVTNAVNGTLAENNSLQPCYLTLYLKASKEVQEQSDPWFEVVLRVERPDVIILLSEGIDKLYM